MHRALANGPEAQQLAENSKPTIVDHPASAEGTLRGANCSNACAPERPHSTTFEHPSARTVLPGPVKAAAAASKGKRRRLTQLHLDFGQASHRRQYPQLSNSRPPTQYWDHRPR